MYKATMDLCRITKTLQLKFGIILKGNDPKERPIISDFEMNGNYYTNITPYPFITVDISRGKGEPWNPNMSFTLRGMSKYLFTKRLRELRSDMIKEKDLFFMYGGKLCLNPELAKAHRKLVQTGNGKTCMLIPVVIDEPETNEQYEGVSIMVNSPENYSNITFEELEFLVDYLERLDMENMTLNFLNLVVLRKGQKQTTSNLKSIFQGVKITAHKVEELEQEKGDVDCEATKEALREENKETP